MQLLREKADRRTLVFVGTTLLLTYGSWYLHPTGWVAVVLVPICALASFFTATITHNTVHTPVFKQRWLNKLFQIALTLGYGHPVSAYVPGHNLSHHLHPQSRRDVMRTTKLRYDWNLLNQLLFMPTVATAIGRSDFDYARAMYKERPRWFRQWLLEWGIFIGVQIPLLYLDPMAFLLFVFIPHNFAAWGIVGINFVQHDGCDADHPYNHSRNLTGSWINWWAFNNGYHAMHHHKAGLHWTKLPEAHAAEIAPFNHANLNQPNLFVYAWQAYISPGIRIDYLGEPLVLPEEGPDESWIPGHGDTPADVSLGAEG